MRINWRAWLGVVVVLLAFTSSRSIFADSLPDPELVSCGSQELGYLSINQYQADNPSRADPDNLGATMEATFDQQETTCNLNLHWIQAIVGGSGTIGQSLAGNSAIPYLDPYKRDDNLPYYWTEDENTTVGKGTSTAAGAAAGTHFFDAPNQNDSGAAVANNSIHFETALVAVDCDDPLKLYWLAGFTWGYTVNGTGTMSTADPFSWTTGPSAAMVSAVEDFDGTDNYVGDGSTQVNNDTGGIGYQFVPGCPMCCVPLPGAASMGLACFAIFGIFSGVRSKFAQTAKYSSFGAVLGADPG